MLNNFSSSKSFGIAVGCFAIGAVVGGEMSLPFYIVGSLNLALSVGLGIAGK